MLCVGLIVAPDGIAAHCLNVGITQPGPLCADCRDLLVRSLGLPSTGLLGMSKSLTYTTFYGAWRRCYDPSTSARDKENYQRRNIGMDPLFLHPDGTLCFEAVLTWRAQSEVMIRSSKCCNCNRVGFCPDVKTGADFYRGVGLRTWPCLQADRIDNDGPYGPYNLHYVPSVLNNRNRRNTKKVEHGDAVVALTEAAERTGLGSDTLRRRVEKYKKSGDELYLPVSRPGRIEVTVHGMDMAVEDAIALRNEEIKVRQARGLAQANEPLYTLQVIICRMSRSRSEYKAAHPGATALDLADPELLRKWAREAVDSPIDFKLQYHGMVKIDGAWMTVPAALPIRQVTWAAIWQRMRGGRAKPGTHPHDLLRTLQEAFEFDRGRPAA